jgi:broad specificity phosphatase PhoE
MVASHILRIVMSTLIVVGIAGTLRPSVAEAQPDGSSLVDGPRRGGYVLLFRHAATDFSQRDSDRQRLENCATQRNLSDDGRAQAALIGQRFRELEIPVGAVLASPYCRTLETATIAFGRVEPSAELISELSDDTTGSRERLTAALRAMLAQAPEPGTNTVLVTHTLNIEDATGLDIEEGEAIVALPDGAGSFTVTTGSER